MNGKAKVTISRSNKGKKAKEYTWREVNGVKLCTVGDTTLVEGRA